jgi:homoserine kinase
MSKIISGIKVAAPASISNLNCGYNALSLSLSDLNDEVVIHRTKQSGISIKSISGDKQHVLSFDIKDNIAGLSAFSIWRHLTDNYDIDSSIGLELEIRKKIPFTAGLGSNEALAVAAAMAVNEFYGGPLTKREMLPLIASAEWSLFGGLNYNALLSSLMGSIFLARDVEQQDYFRLPVPKGLSLVVINYNLHLDLSSVDNYKINDAFKTAANLASLVYALYNSDFALISRSMQDLYLEPKVKNQIPLYDDLKNIAIFEGALSFGLSANSTTLFALFNNSLKSEGFYNNTESFLKHNKVKANLYSSLISLEGSELL